MVCALTMINVFAQETQEVINKGFAFTEIFHIDKLTKHREGNYLKIKIKANSQDTLITGYYQDNNRTGIWNFNASKNRPYLCYDYSKQEVKIFPKDISRIDSFLVKTDSTFALSKIDRAPVYLGYKSEFTDRVSSEVKIPISLMEEGKTGACLYTFVVDSDGKMTQIKLEQKFEKEFDANVLNAIKRTDSVWLPAIKQGKPVDSKFFLLATVNINQIQKKFTSKDNLIVLNFVGYRVGNNPFH